jgi:hypothetical protein
MEEDKEKIIKSEKVLDEVYKTINRQVLSLASTVAFYNLHQSIAKPDEEPLTVTVGGVKYTRNVQTLKRRFEIEEGYWKNFMCSTISQKQLFSTSNSSFRSKENSPPPGFESVGETSPTKGTFSGPLDEGVNSRVAKSKFLGKFLGSDSPRLKKTQLLKTTSF